MNNVFHATSVQGLTQINPAVSYHGVSWVYAARDWVMASVFLSQFGYDFTCTVGRAGRDRHPYVCERFPGAINLRYGGKAGAIYSLPGEHFMAGMTSWSEELVCPFPVSPLSEVTINEVENFLCLLESYKKLVIYRYPRKPEGTPADDSDLIARGREWFQAEGEPALRQLEQWNPALAGKVLRAGA
jgi:hypothetical protein